jgi:hypothetical protein
VEATLLVGVNTTAGRALDVVFLDDVWAVEGSSGSMVCSSVVFVFIVLNKKDEMTQYMAVFVGHYYLPIS